MLTLSNWVLRRPSANRKFAQQCGGGGDDEKFVEGAVFCLLVNFTTAKQSPPNVSAVATRHKCNMVQRFKTRWTCRNLDTNLGHIGFLLVMHVHLTRQLVLCRKWPHRLKEALRLHQLLYSLQRCYCSDMFNRMSVVPGCQLTCCPCPGCHARGPTKVRHLCNRAKIE